MRYTDTRSNITFNDVKAPTVLVPGVLGRLERLRINNNQDEISEIDEEKSLINSIDIDWNGADMGNTKINTTADLLNYIKNNSGNGGENNTNPLEIFEQINYYKWFQKSIIPNVSNINELEDSWTKNYALNRPSSGDVLWMCLVFISGENISIKNPILISGEDGLPGKDNTKREYIYKLFPEILESFSGLNNPYNWSAVLENDYTGPTNYKWKDDAQSVNENMKCEYVSYRDKEGNVWGKFSLPTLWAHFGKNGLDGGGVEYAFIRTSIKEPPVIIHYAGEENLECDEEYLPVVLVASTSLVSGNVNFTGGSDFIGRCTDDPVGVDNQFPYEWVVKRKFIKNSLTWESYYGKTMSLWGIKGLNGTGDKVEVKNGKLYINNEEIISLENPGGQGIGVPEVLTNPENSTSLTLGNGSLIIRYNNRIYVWDGTQWVAIGLSSGSGGVMHIAFADKVTINNGVVTSITGFTVDSTSTSKKWTGFCFTNSQTDPGANLIQLGLSSVDINNISPDSEISKYKWNFLDAIDGNGVEFIFCLTKEDILPRIYEVSNQYPSITYGNQLHNPSEEEYYPLVSYLSALLTGSSTAEGYASNNVLGDVAQYNLINYVRWTDDPNISVNSTWKYLWEAIRKKNSSGWLKFGNIRKIDWYTESSVQYILTCDKSSIKRTGTSYDTQTVTINLRKIVGSNDSLSNDYYIRYNIDNGLWQSPLKVSSLTLNIGSLVSPLEAIHVLLVDTNTSILDSNIKYSIDIIVYSDGVNSYTKEIYKWFSSNATITAPSNTLNPTGWAVNMNIANETGDSLAKLIMYLGTVTDGVLSTDGWQGPYDVTSGVDSSSYEFIYRRFTDVPTLADLNSVNSSTPAIGSSVLSPSSNDFVPLNWTDNPLGIGLTIITVNGLLLEVFYKYEYASIRIKQNGLWLNFIEPFPWSVYGDTGKDGDGVLYIFRATNSNIPPNTPKKSSQNNLGEWLPINKELVNGNEVTISETLWVDDPPLLNNTTNKYIYVSTIKQINGNWGEYSDPTLWAKWSEDGDSGYYPETITKEWEAWSNLDSTANESTAPTTLNNSESDWLENGTPQKPNNPEFKHLWRRSLICDLQSDKTYIGRKINGVLDYKYIRLSGTSGTEINLKAKGTVLYILPAESSSDYNGAFNTVGNGELFIIDNVKAVYKKTGNQKTVEISGNDISNGDCYTIQKSSIINESDVKGHLFMWSDEADADGNWIDLGQFQGEEGKTYYTNILWASKLVYQNNVLTSVIGVSVSPSSEKDYMGIYISESLIEDVSILNNEILVSIPWKYIRGPKGTDGVYREWIYSYSNLDNPNDKASGRIHGEGNLTSDKSLNDWVPEGFNDSPLGISENNKTEYTWYRDKDITTNAWEDFQGPITWAKWGDRGTDGDGVEYVFIRTKSNTPPNIASSILEYTYDSTTYRSINDEYLPLIAKSDDLDSSGGVISTINNIDYVKCTDDPSGVNDEYLYEWVAKRKKSAAVNGVRTWNNYLGKMSLWAKWSEDGPPGYTIEADRNIILNEDISTPGSFIPITSYLRVKKGSIDCSFTYSINRDKIPPADTGISGKYLTVTSNLPSLQTTTHSYEISGVLNNNNARAISNYTFDIVLNILDPDTSSTFNYTISINVAVNYLGTWRTTVIGDVETSVGTKINLALIDGKYVKEEKIGEYIRSSGLNVSELTTKIDGVIKDISKIELTSDHISAFVTSSKDFPLQLISNEKFIDTEIINNKIKVKDWSYNSEYWELSTNLAKTVWKNNLLNLNNNYNLITADYNQIGGNKYLFSFDLKTSSNEIYSPKSSIELSDDPLLISRVYLKAGITYTIAVNYNRADELEEDDYSINFILNNNDEISYAVDPDASLIIPELDGLYEVKVSGTGALSKITCNISTIKVKLINENSFCGNIIVDGEIVESNYSDSDFSYLFTSDSNINTHHTILLEIDDNNKEPGNVTFYHTLNGPSVIISNLSLKPYGFSNLLGNLYKTGIDIQSGKITAKTDNFEIRNSNDDVTFSVDGDGNIVGSGGAEFSGVLRAKQLYHKIYLLSYYDGLKCWGSKVYQYIGSSGNFVTGDFYDETYLNSLPSGSEQSNEWINDLGNNNLFIECVGGADIVYYGRKDSRASTNMNPDFLLPDPMYCEGKLVEVYSRNLGSANTYVISCVNNNNNRYFVDYAYISSAGTYTTHNLKNTATCTIEVTARFLAAVFNGTGYWIILEN